MCWWRLGWVLVRWGSASSSRTCSGGCASRDRWREAGPAGRAAVAPLGPRRSLRDQQVEAGVGTAKKVAELATQRLSGDLQAVWAAMSSVEAAQKRRNEVIHQDWVLRAREAMRSVTEIAAVANEDRGDYLAAWQRQATESATGSGCQLARLTWCQPKPWRSCGPSNGSWRR